MIGCSLITKYSQDSQPLTPKVVNTGIGKWEYGRKATQHPRSEQELQENSYAYFDPSRWRNPDGG